MICVAAVLPLYSRLGMSPLVMACLIMLSSGVLNMTPWGGPTARAAVPCTSTRRISSCR